MLENIIIIYSGFGIVMGQIYASEKALGPYILDLESSLIHFSVIYVSLQYIFKKSNPILLSCWLKITSSRFLLSSSVMGILLAVLFVSLIVIPGILSITLPPAVSVEVVAHFE